MMYSKIKMLAKEQGVSINKMEKDLEFGSSTISKWSKSIPSVDKLKKVADYLDVTIDELLRDEELATK
ncbi:XRE family transcriptional regulator [Latilactobacillus curvatus]|uniref:XRE family transcriptional regulator n=2 Tax=Latilactobacillus curvatus TaxID=28038 RepID=A0A385AET5_LATCU|nr:XRE family transcriptional regulator [Latilactobacillus curvatus]AXN36219.1 XRE family transcriptional regulator [Latilactobacillus curvatus]